MRASTTKPLSCFITTPTPHICWKENIAPSTLTLNKGAEGWIHAWEVVSLVSFSGGSFTFADWNSLRCYLTHCTSKRPNKNFLSFLFSLLLVHISQPVEIAKEKVSSLHCWQSQRNQSKSIKIWKCILCWAWKIEVNSYTFAAKENKFFKHPIIRASENLYALLIENLPFGEAFHISESSRKVELIGIPKMVLATCGRNTGLVW